MGRRFKNDRELLEACFDEDRGAMEEFIRNFSKLVYYSIHRAYKLKGLSPRPEEVEDLFGDIFLSLFDDDFAKLRSFEGRNGCTLASWIRLIAGRKSIDHIREQVRMRVTVAPEDQYPIEDHADEGNPEENILDDERTILAHQIIPRLPADDLLFLTLYYEQQKSPEEIAEYLGVSVGTVYSRKHRLIEKMRKMVGKIE